MLYVIATPIGNLEDITIRAVKTLRAADLILAEDTRKAKIIFCRYAIKKPVISFHDHNKKIRTKRIIPLLKENKDIALISEAGTPGISDPGFFLLRECRREKIPFTAIPGPTAIINALILSGLPTDRFFFYGFLSSKKNRRRRELGEQAKVQATLIFFESRHRIISALEDIKRVFPERPIAVAKEMTKKYENVYRGGADEIIQQLNREAAIKGEFVIVIDNREKD
ncbi:MAG: 16S rRNA (cytidine(1402)-2'-O)-methyltransferase [Candidatus Omnitrophota bacterium]